MFMVDSVICIIDLIFVVVYVFVYREKCKKNCFENYEFYIYI